MEKAKKIIGLILISIGITTAVAFWIMLVFAIILDNGNTVWDGLNSIRIEISWAILLGFIILSGAILLSGTGKE